MIAYYDAASIRRAVNLSEAIDDVAAGFDAYSRGDADVPPVGYLNFPDAPGDCHIKFGHIRGQPEFAIKVATGFYANPAHGLPSSNGLIVLLSAKTGVPIAILDDEGFLTDLRTAIAGTIAARHCAPSHIRAIGIVGTGIQAKLQLQLLHKQYPDVQVVVWGRSDKAAAKFSSDMEADGIFVEALAKLPDLCDCANLIVTTTPSTSYLIASEWIRAGTHITAVGADAPGKQELDPHLWSRAALRVVDSRSQCIDHGEVYAAVRDGIVSADSLVELGEIVADPRRGRTDNHAISIADLTGLAVQDIQIARHVWTRLQSEISY